MKNHEPIRCPKCNSRNISAESFEQITPGSVYRNVICDECNYKWTEEFQFVGVCDNDDAPTLQTADEMNIPDIVNYVVLIDTDDNSNPLQYMFHANDPDTFRVCLETAVIGWIKRMRSHGATAARPFYTDVLLDFDVRRSLAANGIRYLGCEAQLNELSKDVVFDHLPSASPIGKYRLTSDLIAQLQDIISRNGDVPIIPSIPKDNNVGMKVTFDPSIPAIRLDMYGR